MKYTILCNKEYATYMPKDFIYTESTWEYHKNDALYSSLKVTRQLRKRLSNLINQQLYSFHHYQYNIINI